LYRFSASKNVGAIYLEDLNERIHKNKNLGRRPKIARNATEKFFPSLLKNFQFSLLVETGMPAPYRGKSTTASPQSTEDLIAALRIAAIRVQQWS
jgi:hypothetical protein